jgi:hypothetical protein
MQSNFMLSVSYESYMVSVIIVNIIYAECKLQALYAECHYAKCQYAEFYGAFKFGFIIKGGNIHILVL